MYNENIENNMEQFGIHELRTIARDMGVKSPTTKKKDELIDSIKAISSGELKPEFNNKFGRPVKKHSNQSSFIMQLIVDGDTDLEERIKQANNEENMFVFEQDESNVEDCMLHNKMSRVAGILRQTSKGTYYFLNSLMLSEQLYVIVEESIVNQYNLIVGDYIDGSAVLDNKEKVAKFRIIQDVNYKKPDENILSEDTDLVIPNKILEEPNFKYGQSKIVGVEDVNDAIKFIKEKTEIFSKQNIKCVVVGLEISIETKLRLDKISNLIQIVSTYEDRASISQDKLLDAQNFVLSQFKRGENVVLFVLNIMQVVDVLKVSSKDNLEEQTLLLRKTISQCRATNSSSISVYNLYNLNQEEDYKEEIKFMKKLINN